MIQKKILNKVEVMIKTSVLSEKQKSVVLDFLRTQRQSEINKLYMLLIEDPQSLQAYADFVEELVNRKTEDLSPEEIEKIINKSLVKDTS
jgi:hypothetical protein